MLNCSEPDDPASPVPAEEDLELDLDPPTLEEVKHAIKYLKNRKSPGIDNIYAEMLKADTVTSANILLYLFVTTWEEETLPSNWRKGLIVKLAKKGVLQICDNWKGITLLSVPSKMFCKILHGRIDEVIDDKLREEQDGFRRGRGCIDQILSYASSLSNVSNGKCHYISTTLTLRRLLTVCIGKHCGK